MGLSIHCRLYPNRLVVAEKLKEKNEKFLVECVRKSEIGYVTDKNGCLQQVGLNYGLNNLSPFYNVNWFNRR
jgi:GTP:adenosylcobinamide-phosphate guanylyltransferase